MRNLVATMFVALTVLVTAGCAEEPVVEGAEGADAFCAEFQTGAGMVNTSGWGSRAELTDASAFFRTLEVEAPEEISSEVSTVAEGLEAMSAAFGEYEGAEGLEALQAVQEAAEIDLDEVSAAADDVQAYAVENCENVEPLE